MTVAATSSPIRFHRVLGILVLLALAAEAAAYVGIWYREGTPFESFEFYRWSPYGLVRNNPELTSRAFHINNAGLRATRPATREKKPNTFRVIVLGGSVAYAGLGRVKLPNEPRVTSDQTVAQYLENKLRTDPALRGREVEVLNAGVNFNRIPEVSSGYLTDWRFWDADLVVVMGSANNFGYAMPTGTIARRENNIQTSHPWAGEFELVANGTSLAAFGMRIVRSLAQHSAAVAVLRKALQPQVDAALMAAQAAKVGPPAEEPPAPALASMQEYDAYVDEYLGYALAMVAAGRVSNQKLVFFWEYFIAHLDGIRPFNEEERYLYEHNKVYAIPQDKSYDFYARDRVRERVEASGALFVDPLDVLKSDDSTIFMDYLHYTANGNRVMAERIYDSVREWVAGRAEDARHW